MSFLSYKLFTYINLALSVLLLILPWFVSPSTSTSNIVLTLLAVVEIVALVTSKDSPFSVPKLGSQRIVLLVTFLVAVILNFLPYLLKFTSSTNLLWTVFSISGITLLSILVTKFTSEEKK